MNTVIIVHDKHTGKIVSYTSLQGFIDRNKGYSINTLNNYICRLKQPYQNEDLVVMRVELIGRK